MQKRIQETKAFEDQRAEKLARWQVKVDLLRKVRRKQKAKEAAARRKAQQLDAKIKVKFVSLIKAALDKACPLALGFMTYMQSPVCNVLV